MRLFLIIMFTVCLSVNARIGETLEECNKRYGKATFLKDDVTGAKIYKYSYKIHEVSIYIYKGKCHKLIFDRIGTRDANKVIEENVTHPMKDFKIKTERGSATGESDKFYFILKFTSVCVQTKEFYNIEEKHEPKNENKK